MNEEQKLNPDPEEIRSIFDDPEEEELLSGPAEAEIPEEEVIPVAEEIPAEELPPVEEPVSVEELLPEEEPVSAEELLSAEEAVPAAEDSPAEEVPAEEGAEEADPFRHALLEDPQVGDEILADETALAGLSRHGDAELERILQETMDAPAQQADIPIQEYQQDADRKEEEEMDEEIDKTAPKGRPKMKKGYGFLGIPHILSTVVWLAIIVLIGVTLGRMLWVSVSEVLAFGKPDQTITVTISVGDNIDTITAKLKAAGLIKYPELFKMYANLTNAQEELSAGTFTLNTKYDYFALVNAMSYHSPARETVELVIPEGYTCAQIFALLEEANVCTAADLEEYAASGEIKERWFLEGLERGDKYCLEGYLFPDTYEFYTDDEPGRVLGKFLDNFDARFTDLMKSRIETLNERMSAILRSRGYEESVIEERKFTIRDIIIIASMIEKETANDAESYDISSVIYNRLTNPANYPFLNIDATLIYALGGNVDPETGKTKPLTDEDLQMEHPYNTYTTKGLIPGPISNPGRNSLNAALEPTETSFYFYVYNPNTSTHLFAKTPAEHEKNVNYVRSLEED